MPKVSVDYKTIERQNATIVTKQMKQVFEETSQALVDLLVEVLNSPGLEYLTVRRVKEKVFKNQQKSEVKK